jgi:hypothetical protein
MESKYTKFLHELPKPSKEFIYEKECLICLESFDIESQNFIMLPCLCSNSTYHKDCILKFLNSGENKNFCPHCKTIYNIPSVVIQHVVIRPIDTSPVVIQDPRQKQRMYIFVIHIVFNSVMNISNVALSGEYKDINADILSKILIICYYFKILINYFIVIRIKDNRDTVETALAYSYCVQTILFFMLIGLMSIIKNDLYSIALFINNFIFCFGDLSCRLVIENKFANRIYAGQQ